MAAGAAVSATMWPRRAIPGRFEAGPSHYAESGCAACTRACTGCAHLRVLTHASRVHSFTRLHTRVFACGVCEYACVFACGCMRVPVCIHVCMRVRVFACTHGYSRARIFAAAAVYSPQRPLCPLCPLPTARRAASIWPQPPPTPPHLAHHVPLPPRPQPAPAPRAPPPRRSGRRRAAAGPAAAGHPVRRGGRVRSHALSALSAA
jgi:hypothetical protein